MNKPSPTKVRIIPEYTFKISKLIKNYFKLEWMETPFDFFLFKIVLPILIIIQIYILLYCIWGAITGQTPPSLIPIQTPIIIPT
jgi:hypothetical protein